MRDRYYTQVISPGDKASAFAKKICFQSHGNCPAITVFPHQPGNVRGPVGYCWNRHILQQMMDGITKPITGPDSWTMLEEVENDGAGGKPQFFTLIGTPEVFRGLGWEIITMTADDFARSGRFPAVIANEMNVQRITDDNFHLYQTAMEGYGAALRQAGLVNITGETAIMKHSITAFCDTHSDQQLVLTWGATCIGLAHHDLLIDGSKILPGMDIVGFRDPGYRCNGGTFLTNITLHTWGPRPRDVLANEEALKFVKALTVPSQSYARTISRLVGWNPDGSVGTPLAKIYGIAHITGGGVWGKFGELLPEGVGADLHNMPKPADVLLRAQELSLGTQFELSDYQAYGTLHGGCGMLVVCDARDSGKIMADARHDGIRPSIVGHTTHSPDREVTIRSRFREGKLLSSLRPE